MSKPLLLAVNAANYTLISVLGVNITANQLIDILIYVFCAVFSRVLASSAETKFVKVKEYASAKATRAFELLVNLIYRAIEVARENRRLYNNRKERRLNK